MLRAELAPTGPCLLLTALLLSAGGGAGTSGGGDGGLAVDAAAEDAGADEDAGPAALDAGAPDAGAPDAGVDAGPEIGTGPPYPIVLAHGFFGFEDFAGIGFIQYFYGVRDELAARGEVEVFTPAVDPFNDSETRGRQLLAHVERILAETGAAKVNLIGHSQGGLDARVVASLRPDLVASVTTFATPHGGAPIADVILGLVDDDRFGALADQLVRLIAAPLWDEAGEETSVFAALRQLSSPGVEALNTAHPDAEGVAYYSLTGRSDLTLARDDCDAPGAPDFITRWARERDPIDPLLDIPEQITDGGAFSAIPNDGLVRVRDARWGRFLGCVPADHLDEVGHLLGDGPGFANDFDHLALWVDLVAFLRAEGF